jgi:anaerobic selenocysteine-containing dehydrogenase
VHPADAAAAGLVDGASVVVTSRFGTVEANVEIDPNGREGALSMTHGRGARSPGSLTSSRVDVDPLTAMPRASGVAVTIEASPRT